jgi:hypothetical protein
VWGHVVPTLPTCHRRHLPRLQRSAHARPSMVGEGVQGGALGLRGDRAPLRLAPEEAVTPQPATMAPAGPFMTRSALHLLWRPRAGNHGRHVEAHGARASPRRSPTSAGGLALTQEPSGSTLRAVPGGRTDRRRRGAGRAAPRSGAGRLLLGRKSTMARQSHHGQRHGQSAAAPVPSARPLGGQRGEARRSVHASALPSLRGAGMLPGSPAARGGSPAATGSQPLH